MGFWSKVAEGKHYRLCNTPKQIEWLFKALREQSLVAFDIETNHATAKSMAGQRDIVVGGISFSWEKNQAAYLPLYTGRGRETFVKRAEVFDRIVDRLAEFLAGPAEKGGHNVKFDALWIYRVFGVATKNIVFDTMLMHHLLDEDGELTCRHGLKPMACYYLDPEANKYEKELHSALDHYDPVLKRYTEVDLDILYAYACSDADYTLQLFHLLEPQLVAQNLDDLFYDVVMPLQHTCLLSEIGGMPLDVAKLQELDVTYRAQLTELQPRIFQACGYQFDIASPQQTADVLYNKLGLPVQYSKKHKGVTTDDEALEFLKDAHPAIPLLSEFRHIAKLHSSYVEGVHKRFDPSTNKLYPTFLVHGTVTGRLSCIAEWVELKTDRGFVPVIDVKVGDLVWTHRGRWQRVLRKITKGIGDMYDVRFSNGEVLTCTTDHRVLLSDKQTWLRVGVLVDEYLKNLGERSDERGCCYSPVQKLGFTYDRSNCKSARDDISQRCACAESMLVEGREESASKGALLSFKDRKQEPYEGQDGGAASQLEGYLRGWLRVSDLPAQWQTCVCAPSGDGSSIGVGGIAGDLYCTPYRYGQAKQCIGQSCAVHSFGTSSYSLLSSKGLDPVTVAQVSYRGRFEVHDLTVEEDSSYEACGVFSHNSEEPNVQNWPRPEHGGVLIKSMFLAGPGHKILMADYSQIELRMAAHCSQEPAWVTAFRNNADVHSQTAKNCYKLDCDVSEVKKLYEDKRSAAKVINFGIIYGMSKYGLAPKLKMTVEEAEAFIKVYFDGLPVLSNWIDGVHASARALGYVENPFGRRRRLPAIQRTIPPRITRPRGALPCWGNRKEAPPIIRVYYPDFDFGTGMDIFSDVSRMQFLARDMAQKNAAFNKCSQCPAVTTCVYDVERRYRLNVIQECERQSVNAIIQSAASDMAAMSYSKVLLVCKANGIPISVEDDVPGIRPWNIIHDELCYIVNDEYVEPVKKIMEDVMLNIYPECLVPLAIDFAVVDRLSDKHNH